jgi:uncharacterized protein YjbI with pentapeptide repeats
MIFNRKASIKGMEYMARRVQLWKITVSLALGICFFFLIIGASSALAALRQQQTMHTHSAGTPTAQQATPTEDPTVTALNKEKLEQEVEQLRNQNFWSVWTNLATPLSILAVLGGGLFGLLRYFTDRRDERNKELKDRENEREKRAEERFQKVVEGLGSTEVGTKVGAAIMLRTFLQSDYTRFYRQAFDLTVANLRLLDVDQTTPRTLDSLSQALTTAFKEAFPLARGESDQENALFHPQFLDASRVQLDHAYLTTADLKKIWMPEAFLRKANLRGTDLSEADLRGTNLSEAILSEAILDQANLSGAYLSEAILDQANLSGAYLGGAHLSEAILDQANLSGANLYQADLSKADLSKAHLSKANLDRTNLSEANLYQADLGEAHLNEANLSGAHLNEADLGGAHLSKANLSGAILIGAHLNEAHLSGAHLDGAIMINVHGVDSVQLAEYKQRGAITQKPTASKDPLPAATTPLPLSSDTPSPLVAVSSDDMPLSSSSTEGTNED